MARAPKIEEERPPHDALEGVSLPRETSILIGHEAAERTLLDAYRSGRMHHGWILAGERGIGKATLAYRLARFLFAHPDPGVAGSGRGAQISPSRPTIRRRAAWRSARTANLLALQREWDDARKRYKSELSVDTVRRIIPFLGTTAGEGGWRVVIVDPADDMSPSAANAMLKNLEEPPRQTLFLLTARRRGALLPTILSRTRTLELSPLSTEQTEAVLQEVAPDYAEPRGDGTAAALAGGSPRRLIELRQSDGVALYRLLLAALERGDRQAQLRLSALAADRQATGQFLELFEGYLVAARARPAGARCRGEAAGRAACHLGGAMGEGGAFRAGGRGIQSRPPAVRARSPRAHRRLRLSGQEAR